MVNQAPAGAANNARRARWGAQDGDDAYVATVKTFLIIILVLLMLGTLGVLFGGLIGMVRGGGDPHRSNALMRWRILLQAAALLLFALIMAMLRS